MTSALDVLIGQELVKIERIHDYHQLEFTTHLLNVFSSMTISGGPLSSGWPRRVISVVEVEDGVELRMTNETSIHIDLRSSAWTGPEALGLYRGDVCIAVWN